MRLQLGSWSPRLDEARTIAGHLGQAVAELAPPGAGRLDDVWEAVDPEDRAFAMALDTWRDSGLDADKARLRTAYRALLEAWRRALGAHGMRGVA